MRSARPSILGLLALATLATQASAGDGRDGEAAANRPALFFSHDRLVHRSHLYAPERFEADARRLRQRVHRKVLPQPIPGDEQLLQIPPDEVKRLIRMQAGFHVAVLQASGKIAFDRVTGFALRGEDTDRPLAYFTTERQWPDGLFYVLSTSREELQRSVAPAAGSEAPEQADGLMTRLARFLEGSPKTLEDLLRGCMCFSECPCSDLVDATNCTGQPDEGDPEDLVDLRHSCFSQIDCACGALVAAKEGVGSSVAAELRRIIKLAPQRIEVNGDGQPDYVVQGKGPQAWLRFTALFLSGREPPLLTNHSDLEQVIGIRDRWHLLLNRFEPGTGARAAVLMRIDGDRLTQVFVDDSYSD